MTLSDQIGEIAQRLLGPPNERLSTNSQLRFGNNGSVAVEIAGSKAGQWFDHEHGIGGGVREFLQIEGGVSEDEIDDWLRREGFVYGKARSHGFDIVATYDYQDETGKLLFQVCRLFPKNFRQRKPNNVGGWLWRTKDVRKVPYRLPELLAAQPGTRVYIAEGEKDCERLASLGLVATCNPGGAAKPTAGKPYKPKWPSSFAVYFKGRQVVILPDNDDAGDAHAKAIARNLTPVAASVRIVKLPDLPDKGDASDWLGAGHTAEELEALVRSEPTVAAPVSSPGQQDGGLTEDAIAIIFAGKHRGELRFCHDTGGWFKWDGNIWRREITALAFDWCREACREARCGRAAFGKASAASGVERFARADRAFAVTSERWDKDTFLLGTSGGTVELKTGRLRPARQQDYITKSTLVAPAEVAHCPIWLQFLSEATRGDAELIRFLQQWCGYSLTGDIREHALLFIFGPGGNGKGTFLSTVSRIFGDYATVAAMETFTASKYEHHSTDLAMLRGARLVYVSETEEGRAWAENRIKTLTGGDPISARFMRENFFTYWPQFKMTVIGNHKPVLRNVDDANRRRFNLAPFVFKPVEVDLRLAEKLEDEYPAILRWMIDGAIDWQANGLIRPDVVRTATATYFADQDTVRQWVDECCETTDRPPHTADTPASLFASWHNYATANGEEAGSKKQFADRLGALGYQPIKDTHGIRGRGFAGIRVKVFEPPPPSDDYDER
jgi:putative DNA primase/helicase